MIYPEARKCGQFCQRRQKSRLNGTKNTVFITLSQTMGEFAGFEVDFFSSDFSANTNAGK